MASTKVAEKFTVSHSIRLTQELRRLGSGRPTALHTRPLGEALLERLRDLLQSSLPGDLLSIDFGGVTSLTASFADAAFATLALDFCDGKYPDRYVLLVNVGEDELFELEMTLRSRPEREGKLMRNLCLGLLADTRRIQAIGKLEAHLQGCLEQVNQVRRTTARDLANKMALEVNAASSKLKTLHDLRLVRREECRDAAGKQFIYLSLI